ncbi:hypothetical protein [Candidatus Tisiphia endosymbiont of Beris chalybata]|uniref:hypothetical protein n=1 Tax=Candidatus Tisiphia endosymbiont of Beris chalybata TaxID=3066262 RepID=UPI00312C79D1
MPSSKIVRERYQEIAQLVNAGKTEEALDIIHKNLLLRNEGLQLLEQVVEEAFMDKNFKLHLIIEKVYQNALAREVQLTAESSDTDC